MKFRRKKIFITDDSPWFITYLSRILSGMGFQIIPCDDGVEALKLIKIQLPDLILMDIHMPMLDGVSTLKKLKSSPETEKTPVVIVSNDSSRDKIEECIALGCSAYIKKPLDLGELQHVINCLFFASKDCKSTPFYTFFEKEVPVIHNGHTQILNAEKLSQKGIYFRIDKPFRVGSKVNVILPVKSDSPLTVSGNVMYIQKPSGGRSEFSPGMAVEFTGLSNDNINMLTDLMSGLSGVTGLHP